MTMPRIYHTQSKATMTLRAAARELEVTKRTFDKWVELGYVKLVEVGPAEAAIRRVPVSEVERLKREV
jgi:hypothetical protein